MDDGTGHIQLLQDGSQGSIGISCATTASTDLLTQAGQVQSIQGVPLAGGSAYTGTVPVGLPSNITFVPINSLDLESLGLAGAQTVPIATGVTPEGQLIMSGQTLESQGQDSGAKQQLVTVSNASANPELYVPTSATTTSSSNTSLPETIDGTGVLTQATAVSAGVSDPSSSANFNSHNHLQQIQVRMRSFIFTLEVCVVWNSTSQKGGRTDPETNLMGFRNLLHFVRFIAFDFGHIKSKIFSLYSPKCVHSMKNLD